MPPEKTGSIARQNMANGPIARKLIAFAVPILLGDLLQQLYNIADSIIVGQGVGKTAFAAVGATNTLTNTLVGFFIGMSVGATALISRHFGAQDHKRLTRAVYTTVIMTLVLGLTISAVGILFTPAMLRLMKTPDDVYPEAVLYLRIYFGGILGLMMYNMLSGILRAIGDSRRPLYFLCFSSVLNLVLDLLFVMGFHWGVAGAATATVISQFLAAGILLRLLSKPEEYCRVEWNLRHFDRKMCRDIITIGLPVALQRSITALSNLLVRSYINAFGTDAMAGWSAFSKVDDIILMPLQSMSMATTTFVGQNLGAGHRERIHKGVRDSLWISVVVTMGLGGAIFAFCRPVVGLFCPDEAVIYYGVCFLRLLVPLRFLSCIIQVYSGALRGLGNSKIPMYFMLFSFVICRQIYLYVGTRMINSIWFVVFGYPFGWLICAVLTLTYYWRKKGSI